MNSFLYQLGIGIIIFGCMRFAFTVLRWLYYKYKNRGDD